MLRADNVICGTSSTGTGTLTLAACPSPPGGLDFYSWLTATGLGFSNGSAPLVSYTIIEYTDGTYATAKQTEKGVGTLSVGANLAGCTLARTVVQSVATGLNTSTPAPTFSGPTAISIGTAANTLIFVGASAAEALMCSPHIDATGDDKGAAPIGLMTTGSAALGALANGTDYYFPFLWGIPLLVKRFSCFVNTAYSGGSPVSNAYARIYDVASSGKAGNLLYDFGLIGSSNASLNSTGLVQSGASGSGFLLMPGEYFIDLYVSLSGGSTPPQLNGSNTAAFSSGGRGTGAQIRGLPTVFSATGGSSSAPQTAATTSWAQATYNQSLLFALKGS